MSKILIEKKKRTARIRVEKTSREALNEKKYKNKFEPKEDRSEGMLQTFPSDFVNVLRRFFFLTAIKLIGEFAESYEF